MRIHLQSLSRMVVGEKLSYRRTFISRLNTSITNKECVNSSLRTCQFSPRSLLTLHSPRKMSFFQKLFTGEPAPDQKTVLRNWTRELNRKIREIERDMESTFKWHTHLPNMIHCI